jgi:hypothetical protein
MMQGYEDILGDSFKLITAFSREQPQKIYVQHRLKEHAKEVNELLEQKACFYVCGDAANMAREVNIVLGQIIAEQRGLSEAKGEEIVKMMRSSNLYQVCSCISSTREEAAHLTGLYNYVLTRLNTVLGGTWDFLFTLSTH